MASCASASPGCTDVSNSSRIGTGGGHPQGSTFVVPANTFSLDIVIIGGTGGAQSDPENSGNDASGGPGAAVEVAGLKVVPGQTFNIVRACAGSVADLQYAGENGDNIAYDYNSNTQTGTNGGTATGLGGRSVCDIVGAG